MYMINIMVSRYTTWCTLRLARNPRALETSARNYHPHDICLVEKPSAWSKILFAPHGAHRCDKRIRVENDAKNSCDTYAARNYTFSINPPKRCSQQNPTQPSLDDQSSPGHSARLT